MRKLFYIMAFSLVGICAVMAQNNTNSPYTRYGFGALNDPVLGRYSGMGGLSIGLRGNNSINPANPASYSSVDSMTFMFDMGVSGAISQFKGAGQQRITGRGNIDYLAIQFSATKWLGFSFGLLPFSSVGYNFSTTGATPYDGKRLDYSRTHSGSGGISQVYLGLSFNLWKRLSIGANACYLWGEMLHNRQLTYSTSGIKSTDFTSNLHVSSFNFRYGIQYTEKFLKKHSLTIGLAYENRSRLRGTYEEIKIDVDTMRYPQESPMQLPLFYGVGLSYTYDDRLTVGIDYSLHEFSKSKSFNAGQIDSLNNRHKWVVGTEYIYNPTGLRYVDRVRWRLGGSLVTSYISSKMLDYGVSVGVGLPLKTAKTMLNLAFEYNKVGGLANNGIREDSFKLTFSATINETWFLKSKIR